MVVVENEHKKIRSNELATRKNKYAMDVENETPQTNTKECVNFTPSY